ncbi:hypothetical protein ACFL51_01585 [Myxococcota bacterium]
MADHHGVGERPEAAQPLRHRLAGGENQIASRTDSHRLRGEPEVNQRARGEPDKGNQAGSNQMNYTIEQAGLVHPLAGET